MSNGGTMTKPAKIEVGQRWSWCKSWTMVAPDRGGWRAVDQHGNTGRWEADMFADDQHATYLGGPTPALVMEEREDGTPARCLKCGAHGVPPGPGNCMCGSCFKVEIGAGYLLYAQAWKAGDRAFPRPPGEVKPVEAPTPDDLRRTVTKQGEDAARISPKPPLREVYAGGSWLNYERLHDPDPFAAYKRRRVDGVEVAVAEPRGYGGKTFAEHVAQDEAARFGMDCMLQAAPKAPTTVTAPAEMNLPRPPQARSYFTPTKDEP